MKWKVKFTFVNEYKFKNGTHWKNPRYIIPVIQASKHSGDGIDYVTTKKKQDATIAGTSHSTNIYLYLTWLGFGLMWKLSKSKPKDVTIDHPHNDASNSVFFIETPGLIGVNTNHCYKNRSIVTKKGVELKNEAIYYAITFHLDLGIIKYIRAFRLWKIKKVNYKYKP